MFSSNVQPTITELYADLVADVNRGCASQNILKISTIAMAIFSWLAAPYNLLIAGVFAFASLGLGCLSIALGVEVDSTLCKLRFFEKENFGKEMTKGGDTYLFFFRRSVTPISVK